MRQQAVLWGFSGLLLMVSCKEVPAPGDAADSETTKDTETNGQKEDTGPASGIDWVVIPPGTFFMGSLETEVGRCENEYRHAVVQTHSFEMAATEITIAQWLSVESGFEDLAEGVAFCPPGASCQDCKDEQCPLEVLSITAAATWLNALSVAAGLPPCYFGDVDYETPLHCPGYRLPTEEEWERAARADDDRATYNGDLPADISNFSVPDVLAPIAWCGPRATVPRPVAQGAPNAFGLYDMLGNVAELALWSGVYEETTPWFTRSGPGDYRFVLRGGNYGSWVTGFTRCRAAAREWFGKRSLDSPDAGMLQGGTGLRPVRTLPESQLPAAPSKDACLLAAPDDIISIDPGAPAFEAPAGARFLSMTRRDNSGPLDILGQHEAEGPFVMRLTSSGYPGLDWSASPSYVWRVAAADAEMTARLMANTWTWRNEQSSLITVLCRDDACALYTTADDETTPRLTAVPGADIPDWLAPVRGIFVDGQTFDVYLVGNGIAVWRDGGFLALAEGAFHAISGSEEFDDSTASHSETTIVAVGESGRIVTIQNDRVEELAPVTDATLRALSIPSDFSGDLSVFAVGDAGTIVSGTLKQLHLCRLEDFDFTGISDYRMGQLLVTADGRKILQPDRMTGLRRNEILFLAEPFVATLRTDCESPLLLTASALYGNYSCHYE